MREAWYADRLACPDCRRHLERELHCVCGFVAREGQPLDLRPQKPIERELRFTPASHVRDVLRDLTIDRPANTWRGPNASRDSSELFSAVEGRIGHGSRLLDLGCGPRDQAIPAAHLGVDYVGVDYDSPQADLLVDAHALPFDDASFDAVLSYAVLEHLYNPFLAVREVARVLRPGGIYFGTVSQGEPFHDSYFHHTAFGTLQVMLDAGLRVQRIWPSYDTLHALSTMGRYPRVQRLMIEAVHRVGTWFPFLAPRQFLHATPREKALEAIYRAASIAFVVEKD